MGKYKDIVPIFLLLLGLSACDMDNGSAAKPQTLSGTDITRVNNPTLLKQGQALYIQHCAQCHGQKAEGQLMWRRPDEQGHYPPPPLDGTGHAWHQSREGLHNIIKNGSAVTEKGQTQAQGRMPAWGQTLNDQQIDMVIDWLQSLWPEPVYTIWYERQKHARVDK